MGWLSDYAKAKSIEADMTPKKEKEMDDQPRSEPQAYRESAPSIALDRAKRLDKQAAAFRTLGYLIEEAVKNDTISNEQEAELWSLLVGTRL